MRKKTLVWPSPHFPIKVVIPWFVYINSWCVHILSSVYQPGRHIIRRTKSCWNGFNIASPECFQVYEHYHMLTVPRLVVLRREMKLFRSVGSLQNVQRVVQNKLRQHVYTQQCYDYKRTHNSTQRASMDASTSIYGCRC